jgi:hypothetical protein
MKKLLLFLIVESFLFLSSCYLAECPDDFKNFSSIEKIDQWVTRHIQYEFDPFGDPWQTPEETLSLLSGDCEDSAILWLYLCNENGFGKGVLEIYRNKSGSVFHAVGKLGGYQFNYSSTSPIKVFEWSYDWAIGLSVVKGKEDL